MSGDAVLQIVTPVPGTGPSIGTCINPIGITGNVIEDVRVIVTTGYGGL